MSIQAVAWVLEHSEATLADRLVLIAIANHADARGWNAYPSVPLIAREALVSERTVYRALETLEESGELTIQRRPNRSSMYAIAALGGDNVSGVRGDKLSGQGGQDVRSPLTNRQPNHKEPSGNRRARAREATEPVIEYDPGTLERDEQGRWFVRTSTPPPKPVTQTTMPPELAEETRAKGAQWARALRRGGDPE